MDTNARIYTLYYLFILWSFKEILSQLDIVVYSVCTHTHIIPHTRSRITPIKISALLRRLKNTRSERGLRQAHYFWSVSFALFHDSREHALKSLSETGIIMLIMERRNAVTDQSEINYSIPNHFFLL